MNPGSRDTPTEEKTQRLSSGDQHGHSKTGGSIVMHDHGRHSPASAHSPGVSGKLPGLHPDSSRSSRGFGTPSFSTTGLPGFNLEHLPFLFNSASPLIFPPFMHPTASSLFPPVLPPNFLPPPLQPPLTSLFPSPNAECEASSSGWSAHSGGSRNTSSLGSSSSEGDTGAKIEGRTIRSSRCSPDVNLQLTSLSSSVRKTWESTVVDPVCISDADMPLSLVTRRETTSRGSSAAESGVCTGDSVARAASTETSRTPSLDGESGCHPAGENSGIQEQTVPAITADQPAAWPASRVTTDTSQGADDGKSSTSDDIWSSSTPASRSSGIALPPRKRLTRNAEELHSSTADQSATSSGAASSPSSAPNFRSCWKKFAAKSNVSGPMSHRAFGGKPQYDCRTYFQKLAEQARAAAASKAFVPGKGRGHCYRNANKASPRSSDQNAGSPRVTRSQSKPKKSQSPKSSPSEPPAPVRKSTRKKSINTRFEEYDRTVGKNKKSKSLLCDANTAVAASEAGKEATSAAGDEAALSTEKNSQRKHRRRGKLGKGESSTDADMSSGICADGEDSTSQSQLASDIPQPVSETDSRLSCTASSAAAATHEGSELSAKTEDTFEPQPSTVITVLPPKFRHFKIKTAAATFDTSQPQMNADRPVVTANESSNSDVAVSIKADNIDMAVTVIQAEGVANEEESGPKNRSQTSVENSILAESSGSTSTEEPKVSQSHSVGGRKSLLYRSGAATESQPNTEANHALSSSQTESSVPQAADAVNDVSVSLKLANEKSEIGAVSSEDVSASEHDKVSSEQSEVLSDSTILEAVSSESSEKAPSSTGDVLVEQPVEAMSTKSSDTKSLSPSTADMDLNTGTALTAVHNTTLSDYPSAVTDNESTQSAELDSGTASVDNATQKLVGLTEVPADSIDDTNGQNKLQPGEGSDALAKCQSSEVVSTASVFSESRLCATSVATFTETSSISCRTKPVDIVVGSTVEESVSPSLKRLLPDDVTVNDDAKRSRLDSVDHCTDRLSVDLVSDLTPAASTAVNFISSSGDHDSQIYGVPNNKTYTVASEQSQRSLSGGVRNSSKPKRSKSKGTKNAKTNRKLKPNRSHRAVKPVIGVEPPVFEKSHNTTAETLPAKSESERNGDKYDPPLLKNSLDGNRETPVSDVTAVVKYAVANSVDKVCDTNTEVSSVQSRSEQKTLRISLVALNESNTLVHRVKEPRTETVCNSDKLSSSSPAIAVYTTTTASVVNNLKQLTSESSVADAEPPISSAGVVMSQDFLALEPESSTLMSQCKSLSIVLEKMHNESSTPLPAAVAKPASRRRKDGPARRRFGRIAKPEVSADESPLAAEKPVGELLPVDDEYKFTDDAVSDSLPLQRALRPDRKASSRKARNSLPVPDRIETSPAATSDSGSRGAASSVDSSAASGNTGVTPNAIQKVLIRPETGSGRSRRRKQNLQEDEDTRSLSPFSQSGSSPAPVVEASLDGHKLKLRITKCTSRSVEASTCDAKIVLPPSSSVESTDDSKAELNVDDVTLPDDVPAPAVEVTPERVSPRRRQLKVEGVRSRFLTLHKPSGVTPSADHVKCRLVKVGRRHWMSVGGEEPDDADSDTEMPVRNSPAAPTVDEMPQHPTRDRLDRLLLVSERKPQRRRGRPPKAVKAYSADTDSPVVSAKRTKKRVKTDTSQLEISFSKPEPPPEVVSRPTRVDPVPWLDCETDSLEIQPYTALVGSSSRTIATDIEEYRSCMSSPAEFMSNIDLAISDALSDCGIEFACNTVLTPRSTFFVPSELERLMEALVLDDLLRQPRMHNTPPIPAARETYIPRSAGMARTFSYGNGILSPVFSPRNDGEVDLLLSQPSLRPRNYALPVDANDSSDNDCTVVGYEYPTPCYPDSVEPPSLLDQPFVDEDYTLPLTCLTDPQLYGCVDLFF